MQSVQITSASSRKGPSRFVEFIYRTFSAVDLDGLIWALDRNRLRIINYHGCCPASLAERFWVPPGFVTVEAFKAQLQYLTSSLNILPMAEAIGRLKDGTLPPRAIVLTFDDGYANNFQYVYPLLRQYNAPATIFVSTAYLSSDDLFPFDYLRIIEAAVCSRKGNVCPSRQQRSCSTQYFGAPLDTVLELARCCWERLKGQVPDEQKEVLRPLSVAELNQFDPALVELAAHSHSHCILSQESDSRRRDEIQGSIRHLEKITSRPVRYFAYPNGRSQDFAESDKQILREAGIEAAFTTMAGANRPGCDLFTLRRYPIGLYHARHSFIAEVAGFRSVMTDLASVLQ